MLGPRAGAVALFAAALLGSGTIGSSISCSARSGDPSASGTSRSAITSGTPTSGDLGVAALLQGGTLVCTATLVAPRVLLTAAHCLSSDTPPEAFFGSTPSSGGTQVQILAVQIHPDFDATTLENDVAMALLADAAPAGATPWALPSAPLGASSVGMALRLVGFGRTGPDDTTPPEKREGTSTIASLTADQLTFGPSPSQTCSGDSGGPAFATLGGVEAIVGVTSSGDPQCAQMATDMRVDAYASFVQPWLQATAEASAGPGDRCWYPANCAPSAGECAAALDDPTLSFCAPPCGSDGSCPAGLQCLAASDGSSLCRHAPPSPGALGATCQVASDCVGGSCLAPASGGGSVCATACFSGLPGFCASGYDCSAIAGDGGQSACFVPAAPPGSHGGGCRVGAGSVPASGEFVALLLAAGWVHRRRRSRRTPRSLAGVDACPVDRADDRRS